MAPYKRMEQKEVPAYLKHAGLEVKLGESPMSRAILEGVLATGDMEAAERMELAVKLDEETRTDLVLRDTIGDLDLEGVAGLIGDCYHDAGYSGDVSRSSRSFSAALYENEEKRRVMVTISPLGKTSYIVSLIDNDGEIPE
jgi:hypothetical protein